MKGCDTIQLIIYRLSMNHIRHMWIMQRNNSCAIVSSDVLENKTHTPCAEEVKRQVSNATKVFVDAKAYIPDQFTDKTAFP